MSKKKKTITITPAMLEKIMQEKKNYLEIVDKGMEIRKSFVGKIIEKGWTDEQKPMPELLKNFAIGLSADIFKEMFKSLSHENKI